MKRKFAAIDGDGETSRSDTVPVVSRYDTGQLDEDKETVLSCFAERGSVIVCVVWSTTAQDNGHGHMYESAWKWKVHMTVTMQLVEAGTRHVQVIGKSTAVPWCVTAQGIDMTWGAGPSILIGAELLNRTVIAHGDRFRLSNDRFKSHLRPPGTRYMEVEPHLYMYMSTLLPPIAHHPTVELFVDFERTVHANAVPRVVCVLGRCGLHRSLVNLILMYRFALAELCDCASCAIGALYKKL